MHYALCIVKSVLYPVSLKQGVNGRLATLETLIKCHRMLGAAFRQYAVTETLCCGSIEYAFFLEYGKSVGIKHLCPLIAVVAGSIASCHDV